MVNRLCILLYFLSELGVPWCVEQPQSSLLELAPSYQWLCDRFDVWKARLHAWVMHLDSSRLHQLC